MLHAKFQDHYRLPFLEIKILDGFDCIWGWRSSWSYDLDHSNKLSFPLPNGLHMKFDLLDLV